MANLVNLDIKSLKVAKFPRQGNLLNNYIPLKNLIIKDGDQLIGDFNTNKLTYSHFNPLNVDIQNYPDGSVNLIINDDENPPTLINSRFSTAENDTFIVPNHYGNKDTNLYDNANLQLDTSLYKTITQLPEIVFDGLSEDGSFPCGMYHFYFKLKDNDGNETDFIGESSSVACHIGSLNDPFSIRMGMENENSEKSVLFTLSKLDSTYDYVQVYYSRVTSGEDGSDLVTYHKILEDFPIKNTICKLQLFGKEPTQLVTLEDLNPRYYYCDHVKTQTICQNRLFLGNVQEQYVDYEQLKNLALNIYPKENTNGLIGNVDYLYNDVSTHNPYGYYNAKNIYYYTGYWPEEYYRFGIVFILNNYSLSSVFNIRGRKLWEGLPSSIENIEHVKYDDDGFIINTNNFDNIYGICQFSQEDEVLNRLYGVEFVIPNNVVADLQKLGIRGYFFVRQNRMPIIIGQGVAIGKTTNNYGNLPVLKDNKSYFTESFLTKRVNIRGEYTTQERAVVHIENTNKKVEVKAAIVPEAILREPLYNQIFLGQDFHYDVIGKEGQGFFNRVQNYRYYTNLILHKGSSGITSFLNIPSGVKIKTNGKDYYSSQAGVAEDLNTFTSVLHDWKHEGNDNVSTAQEAKRTYAGSNLGECVPFQLKRDQVIRGVFGAYVGLGDNEMEFGDLFNIRKGTYDPNNPEWLKQQILVRSYNKSSYYPISDRKEFNLNLNTEQILCYRGDCYICPFTHRIIRNHIDPELPTNDKIVDAQSWNDNFLVITKTKIEDEESDTGFRFINEVIPLYKARNKWYIDDKGMPHNLAGKGAAAMFASLFTFGLNNTNKDNHDSIWEQDLSELQWGSDGSNVVILLPNDSKFAKAGGLGETFGMPNTWYEYGIKKISRSDINSVGLGHWMTTMVRSNINLCLRDINKYQISDKVIFNKERGFYPYYPLSLSSEYKLQESSLINGACNAGLCKRYYTVLPDMPYIKQQYDTRIVFSDVYNGGWKNGFRVFQSKNYQDMPKTYGALVKLVESGGNLVGVMEHGIIQIPVNERSVAAAGAGGAAYINTDIILPQNPMVLSDAHGSIWQNSVLKTPRGMIYGVDTSTKKIWRLSQNGFEIISDMIIGRFLNDNINLKEWEKQCEIGFRDVKTHYNAFKKDIMFVFYNDSIQWNICFNEEQNIFTTFYSWAPSFSANINHTFMSLDLEDSRNYINTFDNFNRTKLAKTYNKLRINCQLDKNGDYNNICYYYDDKGGIIENQTLHLVGRKSHSQDTKNPFYIKDKDVEYHICSLYSTELHDDNKYFLLRNNTSGDYIDFEISINPKYAKELKNKKFIECKIQLEYWDKVINKDGKEDEKFITDFVIYRVNNANYTTNLLWKHGFSGIYDGQHEITPTNWYNKQHPFEFEFVVHESGWVQSMYHNLMIASNNVKPEELQFEIVGDSYDWWKYKDIIRFVNSISANEEELQLNYLYLLTKTQEELDTNIWPNAKYPKLADKNGSYKYTIKSLPYINFIKKDALGKEYNKFTENITDVHIVEDDLLHEEHLRVSQKCNDIKELGRIQGNIEYKEDIWWSEIRPLNFKIAYQNNGLLKFKKLSSSKIRDKYVKVRVKYSGEQLAVIRGILTLLENSQC